MRNRLLPLFSLLLPTLVACSSLPLSQEGKPSPLWKGRDPASIEAKFEHRALPTRDVAIYATLWDEAMIPKSAVNISGLPGVTVRETSADMEARVQRLRAQYLHDQTSFTVTIELENRPPLKKDPYTQADSWAFALNYNDLALKPTRVDVQGVDRFPTRAGGYHYRLVLAVHFPKSVAQFLHEHPRQYRKEPLRLALRITNTSLEKRRRASLGKFLRTRGVTLAWKVTPG